MPPSACRRWSDHAPMHLLRLATTALVFVVVVPFPKRRTVRIGSVRNERTALLCTLTVYDDFSGRVAEALGATNDQGGEIPAAFRRIGGGAAGLLANAPGAGRLPNVRRRGRNRAARANAAGRNRMREVLPVLWTDGSALS